MKFNVTVTTEVSLELEIDANDEEGAMEKACDAINCETYINGSIGFESYDDDVSVEDVYSSDYYTIAE